MANTKVIPNKVNLESLIKDLKPLTEEESLTTFYTP